MASTTILITGANRGIGLSLTWCFLAKALHTVIAAVGNPAHMSAHALQELPIGLYSRLMIVKLDASIEQNAQEASPGCSKNTGSSTSILLLRRRKSGTSPLTPEVKIADTRAHIEPNTYSVIALYQATRELLENSAHEPIFPPMGSSAELLV